MSSLAADAGYLLAQAPAPGAQQSGQKPSNQSRHDRADDHRRDYPKIGQQVNKVPGNVAPISRNVVNYWFSRAVWYSREKSTGGYEVVSAPSRVLGIAGAPGDDPDQRNFFSKVWPKRRTPDLGRRAMPSLGLGAEPAGSDGRTERKETRCCAPGGLPESPGCLPACERLRAALSHQAGIPCVS